MVTLDSITLYRTITTLRTGGEIPNGELVDAMRVASSNKLVDEPKRATSGTREIRDSFRVMTPSERCATLLEAVHQNIAKQGLSDVANRVKSCMDYNFERYSFDECWRTTYADYARKNGLPSD